MMKKIINLHNRVFDVVFQFSDDLFKLFLRLYVAAAFFQAGLLKLDNWDSTLYLFESEYQVPLIPWELAAYLGTGAELILPLFLVLGLATRLVAIELFIFNVIAVISYPVIWNSGFYDHKLWGIMLLVVVIYGQGKVSLDALICKKLSPKK